MHTIMEKSEKAMLVNRGVTANEDIRLFDRKRKIYSEIEYEFGGGAESEVYNVMSPSASGCYKEEVESWCVEKERMRGLDLEDCESGAEISTFISCTFSRETSETSEFFGDSENVLIIIQSPSPKKRPRRQPVNRRSKIPSHMADGMPSASEMEEFFTGAEKYEQKRFAEKYNYDIMKDVPMEGKYQWVRL